MNPSEIKTLEDLLKEVYTEIKIINKKSDLSCVPETKKLIDLLPDKLGVLPFSVPKILKLLNKASMLFSFTLVEEDRKNKIKKSEGHIAADGPVLNSIKKAFEEELAKLFTTEFTRKYTPESAVREFIPQAPKFNNTDIGRIGNTAVMAAHFEVIFNRNVLEYSSIKIDKKLKAVAAEAEPLTAFLPASSTVNSEKTKKPARVSSGKVSEFMNFSGKNPIDRTLAVYGAEFYARICFRNYNFAGLLKIINEGYITKKKDLIRIKSMLQEIRANSDSDLRLQNHAPEINSLQKSINHKLKEANE